MLFMFVNKIVGASMIWEPVPAMNLDTPLCLIIIGKILPRSNAWRIRYPYLNNFIFILDLLASNPESTKLHLYANTVTDLTCHFKLFSCQKLPIFWKIIIKLWFLCIPDRCYTGREKTAPLLAEREQYI